MQRVAKNIHVDSGDYCGWVFFSPRPPVTVRPKEAFPPSNLGRGGRGGGGDGGGGDDFDKYRISSPGSYRTARFLATWGLPAYFIAFTVVYFIVGFSIYMSEN